MPTLSGGITLSTGGMGKSIIAQFADASGNPLNVATLGTTPLPQYGNGWSVPTSNGVVPRITAADTLVLGYQAGTLAVNATATATSGIFSATVTLTPGAGVAFYLRYASDINYVYVNVEDTSGTGALSVAYFERLNWSVAQVGSTVAGPTIAPGTPFTVAVTFNATAIAVAINGATVASFTGVQAVVAGPCGLETIGGGLGPRTLSNVKLTDITGATTLFSDTFPFTPLIPSISIAGGAPIPLTTALWGAQTGNHTAAGGALPAPYSPYVYWPLPQFEPQTAWWQSGLVNATNAPTNRGGGAYLNNPFVIHSAPGGYYAASGGTYGYASGGTAGLFPFQGLPAGQWTVSVTWPTALATGLTASTAVTATITSGSSQANGVTGDGDGTVLATFPLNQSLAPSGGPTVGGVVFQTLGTVTLSRPVNGLTVTLANASASSTADVLLDCVHIAPASAQSTIISRSEAVTFSAPAGWATLADGSSAPALSAAAVTNVVGGFNFPEVSTTAPRTMALGVNPDGDYNYTFVPLSPDFANRIAKQDQVANILDFDANRYPTRLASNINSLGVNQPGFCDLSLAVSAGAGQGDNVPVPVFPAGTYTIEWNGACNVTIGTNAAASEVTADAVITGGAGNKRVYAITGNTAGCYLNVRVTSAGPVNADGTWPCDLQALHIWPPGVNPSSPGIVHPQYASTVFGSVVRTMSPAGTNSNNVSDYSQFSPDTQLGRGQQFDAITVKVASIGPPTAPPPVFFNPGEVPVQVTTTTPHGFLSGQNIQLNDPTRALTLSFTNGATFPLWAFGSICYVVDATTILMRPPNVYNTAAATTITPSGVSATLNIIQGFLNLSGQVAAAVGANADLWTNIPFNANDACVSAMVRDFATLLPAGKKLYVEYSNEVWNVGFTQAIAAQYLGNQLTGNAGYHYEAWYAKRAAEVHALALDAWVAAGRPASDLIRIIGVQQGNAGTTQLICQELQTLGATFDLLVEAGYYGNDVFDGNFEPSLFNTIDLLTADQLSEILDLNTKYLPFDLAAHRAEMTAYGFGSVPIGVYEGSLQDAVPGYGSAVAVPANIVTRSYGLIYHPRIVQQTLYFLSRAEAAGYALFTKFFLSGLSGPGSLWYDVQYYGMPAGTGSMTTDVGNLNHPLQIGANVSEVLAADRTWASLAPAPSITGGGKVTLAHPHFPFREGTLHGGFLSLGI